MGNMCPSGMTTDDLFKIGDSWYTILDYVVYFENFVVIVCTAILFGWYRKLSKPSFIKVMWGLFIVDEVTFIVHTVLYHLIIRTNETVQLERYELLTAFSNETVLIGTVTLMGGHWVFAIKYAEVIFKLPLLIFPEETTTAQSNI